MLPWLDIMVHTLNLKFHNIFGLLSSSLVFRNCVGSPMNHGNLYALLTAKRDSSVELSTCSILV